MTLNIDITHRQGDFTLAATFETGEGLTVISGPSGSGKTTLVNLVAGLSPLGEGRITFGEKVWNDTRAGIFVPPHRRRIGYVFQEARLFPHMSVAANLAYGMARVPKAGRGERIDRVAGLLRIAPLLARRPANLSGGERQRVALGRALLSDPALLLMDEPLSALDAALKAEILPDIERIRDEAKIPILYISHAMDEVARLATRVVALQAGRVIAIGGPEAAFAAQLHGQGARAGAFIAATVERHLPEEGLTVAASPAGTLYLRAAPVRERQAVRVFVPAADIVLSRGLPEEISTLNRLEGIVVSVNAAPASVSVELDCNGVRLAADVTRLSATRLRLAPGERVMALFKALAMEPETLYRRSSPVESIETR